MARLSIVACATSLSLSTVGAFLDRFNPESGSSFAQWRTAASCQRLIKLRLYSSNLCLRSTYHFALHRIVECNPSLFQLWSKCRTKLLFQARYQCVAKRDKVRSLHSKLRVLTTRIADDGLEYFPFIE